jgi:hypothetical protein
MEIPDLVDDDDDDDIEVNAVKTHGYEGAFQVGDTVRVKDSIRIWSVKEYKDEGIDVRGYTGKVKSLELYGRKFKSLCSAITPVKVEIEPTGEGVPEGMSFFIYICI